MSFHTNQLGLAKRRWNPESSSAVVVLPPYRLLNLSGSKLILSCLVYDLQIYCYRLYMQAVSYTVVGDSMKQKILRCIQFSAHNLSPRYACYV